MHKLISEFDNSCWKAGFCGILFAVMFGYSMNFMDLILSDAKVLCGILLALIFISVFSVISYRKHLEIVNRLEKWDVSNIEVNVEEVGVTSGRKAMVFAFSLIIGSIGAFVYFKAYPIELPIMDNYFAFVLVPSIAILITNFVENVYTKIVSEDWKGYVGLSSITSGLLVGYVFSSSAYLLTLLSGR